MARTRTADYPPSQQHLAKMAHALTHPARLAILDFLADRKRRLSGEITACFPNLPRTTISQHLTALRRLGLLHAQANHPDFTMTYWLDVDAFREMTRQLSTFLTDIRWCPICTKDMCSCVDLSYT